MTSSTEQPHLNPVSPQNLLNPIPLYRELRENHPVYWSDSVYGWFITRHRDVMNCFRDPRLSSNRTPFFETQLRGLDPQIIRDFVEFTQKTVVSMDAPDHLRVRRQALAAFSPQMVQSWRPMIQRLMDELLEPLMSRGRMDLAKEISHQLPARVIAELFGVPPEDRLRFQAWSEPIAEFSGPNPGSDILDIARRANTAMAALRDYLAELTEVRRSTPGEDVLSRMLHTQQEKGQMSLQELVQNAMLLLTAGHTTTTDQLSNCVYDLLSHPEELQKLRQDPSLMRSAVEEMMRFSPAVPFMPRIAKEDFQLYDKNIRKGDVIFLGMAAANRDPEAFPDPDRFDITRGLHSKHMSFGFGQHHCMGSGLARSELEIAIQTLLERFPELRLDTEQQPQLKWYSLAFRGFSELPLRW